MRQKRPVTLQTIGEKLGIKPTTVSKALRDKSDVSEETKKRVKEMAHKLGYRPNLIARSLREKRTHAIGAIVPEVSSSFNSTVIRGFYKAARAKGYEVLVMISDEKYENERRSLEYLSSFPVDGIIIGVSEQTTDVALFQSLHDQGLPIVFYDRPLEGLNYSCVVNDDEEAAFKMVKHLIDDLGRKKIAYLGPVENPIVAMHRYQGYRTALLENNIPLRPELVRICHIDEASGYEAMNTIFDENGVPEAVFCVNDLVALGAGKAILQRNLSIPEDITLAGFGECAEGALRALLGRSISTVNQSPFEIGQKAVQLLIEEIENKENPPQPQKIVVKTKLVIRD